MVYIPKRLQKTIFVLSLLTNYVLKKIRSKVGYGSSFSRTTSRNSRLQKSSILKKLGYGKSSILWALACVLLQACNPVDNYILGQDNTPIPGELRPLSTPQKLQEKWSTRISTSKNSDSHLKLKPVVKGKILYTADANGTIKALNKENGELLWTKKLPVGLVSGPAVFANRIVLGTEVSTVVLLNQSDGQQLWETKISSEVLAKPVIVKNKVIVKTIDGNLYALNLFTGETLWVSAHGAPSLILKASSSPIITKDNLALVGYSDGKLDAIDIQTGKLVWQRSISYANGSSDVERLVDIDADPIIKDSVVYLASYQGYVGALSLKDGQFIWRKPASIYKNMIIDTDNLYFADSEDIIWSLNRHNGRVNWKQVALKARGITEPVLLGNYLIVGDKTGLLHMLALQNGDLQSRAQLKGAISLAPTVVHNHIFTVAADGRLSCFAVG